MSRLITIALALCLLQGFSRPAAAADFPETGVVDVFAALLVTEDFGIDFGTVSDNDGTVTLNLADTISLDPSGIAVPDASVNSGDFTITGEVGAAVGIDIAGSITAGLEILNFTTDLGVLPLAGQVLPVTMIVGADLTVDSGTAVAGPGQLLNYTVSVTYE